MPLSPEGVFDTDTTSLKKSTIRKSGPNIQHIAVFKYSPNLSSSSPPKTIGFHALNAKNLECEGYKVLVVCPLEWERMSLNDPEARKDYIGRLLCDIVQQDIT